MSMVSLLHAKIDIGSDSPWPPGCQAFSTSIFDRWLSVEEADSSRLLSYQIALSSGFEREYLEGEAKFVKFYRSLARTGVICLRPKPRRALTPDAPGFLQILQDSLRERRFFDLYFPEFDVRALGRYDRTDTIVYRAGNDMGAVQAHIAAAGLFLLE